MYLAFFGFSPYGWLSLAWIIKYDKKYTCFIHRCSVNTDALAMHLIKLTSQSASGNACDVYVGMFGYIVDRLFANPQTKNTEQLSTQQLHSDQSKEEK